MHDSSSLFACPIRGTCALCSGTPARPLAYVAEDGVVLYPRVVGTPLSHLMRCPREGLAGFLERTGAALRTLHRLPGTVVGPLEVRNFAYEIQAIERASSHIPAMLP